MTPGAIEIIVGPTASGKSALAIEKARQCDSVIINADSMQVYDALPILTARPSTADCAAAPHFLYGVLAPDHPCSAARWREMAMETIVTALKNGRMPIVIGGTGFYIDALLNGLSPMPDIPPDIRAEAMRLQKECGNPEFHRLLTGKDPFMAARLHQNDTQRMIRAWEVMEATGKSLSLWQKAPRQGPPPHWRFRVTLVLPERKELYERCDRRFGLMLQAGALEEAADFARRTGSGLAPEDAPVTHALGFRPLRDHLAGRITLDYAIELAKAETRQYARRQTTWFRHQIKPAENIEDIRRFQPEQSRSGKDQA